MGIARSTLYDPPPVETDDTALVEAISEITGEFEAYGWRRVRAALRQQERAHSRSPPNRDPGLTWRCALRSSGPHP
jgi:hypothetical protein